MVDQTSSNLVECPICNGPTTLSGHASYYDQSSRYDTPVYYCRGCDTLYRNVDAGIQTDHYYAASYVKTKNEQRFFRARIGMFGYVLSLAEKYVDTGSTRPNKKFSLLDFGSSYGHLLDLAGDKGIDVIGVEVNEHLMTRCRKKGLMVYKRLSDVPNRVNVVTMIDSLYYVPNCREVLCDIKKCLQPNGTLIARVTNRNLYARLRSKYLHKCNLDAIGDAIISYSLRGIDRLLFYTGFQIIKVIPDHGQGKKMGFLNRLHYILGYLPTLFTGGRAILTPGFFIVAKTKRS